MNEQARNEARRARERAEKRSGGDRKETQKSEEDGLESEQMDDPGAPTRADPAVPPLT